MNESQAVHAVRFFLNKSFVVASYKSESEVGVIGTQRLTAWAMLSDGPALNWEERLWKQIMALEGVWSAGGCDLRNPRPIGTGYRPFSSKLKENLSILYNSRRPAAYPG